MEYRIWETNWTLTRKTERLGQAFVNDFIKKPWPELFYETNPFKCRSMITQYLMDHQYFPNVPEYKK